MKTIGVGVIGWGFMGKTHTYALKNIALLYPGCDFTVRLVCVCAGHIENAERAARDAGFERFTDDYRALLAMDDVDVVSICTPNDLHEQMAIDALRAGKHVYMDKPLAVTADSADRIAAEAAKHDVITHMVFNNRYWPATLHAKALIDQGRIGRIMGFEARYLHSGSIDPDKPIGWKQQAQGGVLLDMGSHVLDLMAWLVGYPDRVFCAMRTLYAERPLPGGGTERDLTEDHMLATLRLPGGAIGTVEASKIATGSNDDLIFEIRGDKGALRWNSMDPNYLDFYDNAAPDPVKGFTRLETVARYAAPGGKFLPPKNAIGWDRAHTHCYYTFLDAVSRGVPTGHDLREGAKLQHLMAALRESNARGAWVDFDA